MAAGEEDANLLTDRLVSAAGASCVAALLVNPFDVIKTRMQAQAAGGAACAPNRPLFEYGMQSVLRALPHVSEKMHKLIVFKQASSSHCSWAHTSTSYQPPSLPWLHRRWAIASCPVCAVPSTSGSCSAAAQELTYPSMWGTFRRIVQNEGVVVLWRGSAASLAMSVPMVGIYMPLYDKLLDSFRHHGSPAAPVLAGTISRTLAIYCVAPLELARTRLQAGTPAGTGTLSVLASTHAQGAASGPGRPAAGRLSLSALRAAARAVPELWRGVNATLARDVPFSALYWGMLEPTRQELLVNQGWQSHPNGLVYANLLSGIACGGLAAVITTPLDVVKTRHQLATQGSPSVLGTLRGVYTAEGWRGLYRGVAPRAARAAPACGIVVAAYEVLKNWLGEMRAGHGLREA